MSFDFNSDDKSSDSSPSRDSVLQACIITSALMLAFGGIIRQVILSLIVSNFGLYSLGIFVRQWRRTGRTGAWARGSWCVLRE